MATIWAHSGDSHVLEPDDLWLRRLPGDLAERAPRVVRDDEREIVYVDGTMVRRDPIAFSDANRPPGALDVALRIGDLDRQGIWGEAVFPSRGLWTTIIKDPVLARECIRAYNDWCADTVNAASDRLIGTAIVSMLDTDDAVGELQRAAGLGFRAVFMATTPPEGRGFNLELWEPLWAAAEEAGLPLCFHVGTGTDVKATRGPGGAVINYVETFFPGQRTVAHLVASGALDRHPDLKVFIAEGGAAWAPALADRMDEAYRQHGMFVRPVLSELPSSYIYRQVYTSFQHDRTAVTAVEAMGYDKVLWGSDYPHVEGTFPNTQAVLADLFDGVPDAVRRRVTLETFEELFSFPAGAPGEG
ncbi:MAG TPA: amidohydrolase family protein [Acidimicrobiales bacterium]|nr:amidohydrolase family protein [Acidimicrobiales bacterium]